MVGAIHAWIAPTGIWELLQDERQALRALEREKGTPYINQGAGIKKVEIGKGRWDAPEINWQQRC